MSPSEQIWFAVAIAGFLMVLDGSITLFAKVCTWILARWLPRRSRIPDDSYKALTGFAILMLAIYKLFSLD